MNIIWKIILLIVCPWAVVWWYDRELKLSEELHSFYRESFEQTDNALADQENINSRLEHEIYLLKRGMSSEEKG